MKTKNFLIKSQRLLATSMIAAILLLAACKDDEPAPEIGSVEADVPVLAVVNQALTLVDRSNNSASRTWTIEEGTPSTSTDKSASVSFSTSGTKKVTLAVVFDNGTSNAKDFMIEVGDELAASITTTDETSSYVENDVEFEVKFEATVVGDPDSYAWSFPGGTPETSTDASPTVKWLGGGKPEVSLTVTRSADGSSIEVKDSVQVGPINLFSKNFWGFETDGVELALQTWDGNVNAPWDGGVLSITNSGYSGRALDVNFPGNSVYYGMISRDVKSANATNGALKLGDIVLFSYYVKSASDGAVLTYGRIVNHAPSWWEGGPPEGWEGFTAADAQDFQDFAWTQPTCTNDWQRVSVIDTLTTLNYPEAINVFPEFGFENQNPALYSIDNVELKVIGNVN